VEQRDLIHCSDRVGDVYTVLATTQKLMYMIFKRLALALTMSYDHRDTEITAHPLDSTAPDSSLYSEVAL